MAPHVTHVAVKFLYHFLFHPRDIFDALEVSGIHHADLDEDKVLERSAEQADDGKERVQAQTVETVHEEDGGLFPGVVLDLEFLALRRLRVDGARGLGRCHEFVEAVQELERVPVVAPGQEGDPDKAPGQKEGDPSPLVELDYCDGYENKE